MLLQMALFHSFLWLSNIPLYVCMCVCMCMYVYMYVCMYVRVYVCVCMYVHHIFIHLSVSGHLGCFCVLDVVTSAAMNRGAC